MSTIDTHFFTGNILPKVWLKLLSDGMSNGECILKNEADTCCKLLHKLATWPFPSFAKSSDVVCKTELCLRAIVLEASPSISGYLEEDPGGFKRFDHESTSSESPS